MPNPLPRPLALFISLQLLLQTTGSTLAQEGINASAWEGIWQAQGTQFQIRVTVTDNIITVSQVESLGFEWTSQSGEIVGNIARVPVEYAGVTGVVQAELTGADTAIAFAASCLPEFMVVCALAKDRQAIFTRVSGN